MVTSWSPDTVGVVLCRLTPYNIRANPSTALGPDLSVMEGMSDQSRLGSLLAWLFSDGKMESDDWTMHIMMQGSAEVLVARFGGVPHWELPVRRESPLVGKVGVVRNDSP